MVELLGGSLNPFVLPCLGGRLVTPLPLWSKRARPVQGCRLGWGGRSSLLSDPACCMLGQVPLPRGSRFPWGPLAAGTSAPPSLGLVPTSWWPCDWGGTAGDQLLREWLCALLLLRG